MRSVASKISAASGETAIWAESIDSDRSSPNSLALRGERLPESEFTRFEDGALGEDGAEARRFGSWIGAGSTAAGGAIAGSNPSPGRSEMRLEFEGVVVGSGSSSGGGGMNEESLS